MQNTQILTDVFEEVFQHLDNRQLPTVVVSTGSVLESSLEPRLFPQSWKIHYAGGAEAGRLVSNLLPSGPVVFFPAWERQLPRRHGEAHAFEDQMRTVSGSDAGQAILAVALPSGVLRSRDGARFRQQLRAAWQPLLIVEASGVLPSLHPQFVMSLLFARPADGRSSALRMFRLRPGCPDAPAQLARLFRMQRGESRDGYIVQGELAADESLTHDRHKPSLLARKADLRQFGPVTKLGELFEVRRGLHATSYADYHPVPFQY